MKRTPNDWIEPPSGGVGGQNPVTYPTVSFDHRHYVRRLKDNRKTCLYTIAWIGGYRQGSILHFGWQYPHVLGFDQDEIAEHSHQLYCQIAKLVYPFDGLVDKDVTRVINYPKNFSREVISRSHPARMGKVICRSRRT